jgi:dihydroflavonol-4-reductase
MEASTQFWNGRPVAITGATGFIGHHLAMRLWNLGASVTALVRAGSRTERLRSAGIQCSIAPLDQPDAMASAARGADVFFHLAGAVDFGNNAESCRRTNVEGTVNALEAARGAGARRFVHASSIVAVGANRDALPLDESAAWNLEPYRVPYATSKREAEEIVRRRNGPELESVIVNPACVVGPDDFNHSEFGAVCKRFWRGRLPFYSGRGNNFVDVRDVAEGMLLAAEKGRTGERYILGGDNLTYARFFEFLTQVDRRWHMCMRVPLFVARFTALIADRFPRRKGKPYLTRPQARLLGLWFYFDSGKARRELGYQPRPLMNSLMDAHSFWMRPKAA